MIRKIDIKSFGAIKNKEMFFEKNLNIVYGENEAGKSTIHEALRSLLFGFSPSKLENHSYRPWDDSKIFLEGDIITDKVISIARKLSEKAEGSIMSDGQIKPLANRAIDDLNYVSRDVFKQVYAVTLDDMNSLSNRSMELVFDGLVENYGLDFLNSPSDVIKEIQTKENEIYRENRRGKYKLKEIDDAIKTIKSEIRESEKSVDTYFKSKLELDQLVESRKTKSKELNDTNNKIDRVIDLMDIVKEKNYIETLRGEINSYSHSFLKLKEHIECIKTLKSEIDNKKDRLELLKSDIKRENLNNVSLNENERQKLSKRPNYIIAKNYIVKLNQIILDENNKKTIEKEKILSRKILEKDLFSRELSDSELNSLELLDVISLKKHLEEGHISLDKANTSDMLIKVSLPLIFIISSMVALYLNYKTIAYIGAIFISALLMNIYKDLKISKDKSSNHELKLSHYLDQLPIPHIFIEKVDMSYFEKVFSLRDLQIQISKLNLQSIELKESKDRLWNKIIDKLGENRLLSDDVNLTLLNSIFDEFNTSVEEIKLKELANKSSVDRIKEIDNRYNELLKEKNIQVQVLNSKFDYANDVYDIKSELLESLIMGEINIDRAIEIENNFNNLLDVSSKFDEIESLKLSGAEFSSNYISKLKYLSSQLIEELNMMNNSIGSLSEKIKSLYSVDRRNELFANLKELEVERQEIMIKRAILTTTRETISRLDKDFRDENQPDILKYTSDYFSLVTDNKYQKVYMQSEKNELVLRSEFGEKAIDSGFSRGTKEQIYFCLRLAIIKHLCKDKKCNLPIILDDIFVNWDQNRLENLKKLLLEISKERQIIMFTCHKSQLDVFGDEHLINRVIL